MSLPVQEKCNVLILSANLGTGHYQVSNALRLSLKKVRPDLDVVIYDFFDHVDPLFKNIIHFSYQKSIKHFTQGYKWFYEATRNLSPDSKIQHMINAIGHQSFLETIEQLSPDVVVCTFPNSAGVMSRLKSRENITVPLVTVVTDVVVHSQWIHSYVDAYIVAADLVADGLRKAGVADECIYVTGMPLREGFEHQCSSPLSWEKYNLDPDIFTLMIMGGGCGLLRGVESICLQLAASSLPLQILAVTGTNRVLGEKLVSLSANTGISIKVLGYVENIAELMEISNLLLTKAGGVTIFEALAKNLPMLIYKPLPGQEAANVSFLLKHNAAINILDEESAVECIKKIVQNPAVLDGMKESMQTIAKPFASHKAANIILALAEAGHKAIIKRTKPKRKTTLMQAK